MILLLLLFSLVPYCVPEEEVIKAEVAPVLGGWNSVPAEKVLHMVRLLENSYNKRSPSLYWSKFSEVEQAKVQVSNVINYQLTVIVEQTGCLKEEDLETCKTPGFDDMTVERCHYFLVKRPPRFTLMVIGKTCEQM
ncbi:cystatin-2-like [Dendropsophus ebraccatus]|uniref:cystatin-2-like n=1 Tax=Dendropsophus ebraccatus TaxID=150705 RepID=UPI003830FE80